VTQREEIALRATRSHPPTTVIGVTRTEAATRAEVKSHVVPRTWWFDIGLVAAFLALTLLIANGYLLHIDVSVSNWCRDHQPAALHYLARVGNLLGQGGAFTLICTALAAFLAWRRHSIRPLFPVVMAFALTFVFLTVAKDITDRAAPRTAITATTPHPEQFGSGGVSYPSGHLANALVWYGVLALLLSPWLSAAWRWVIRIAPPVILSITTVYLQYHWLSDTIAGILLGSFLWRLIGRVTWDDVPVPEFVVKRGWAGPVGLR
jgi:membrane-associated phospholipid phosphatase